MPALRRDRPPRESARGPGPRRGGRRGRGRRRWRSSRSGGSGASECRLQMDAFVRGPQFQGARARGHAGDRDAGRGGAASREGAPGLHPGLQGAVRCYRRRDRRQHGLPAQRWAPAHGVRRPGGRGGAVAWGGEAQQRPRVGGRVRGLAGRRSGWRFKRLLGAGGQAPEEGAGAGPPETHTPEAPRVQERHRQGAKQAGQAAPLRGGAHGAQDLRGVRHGHLPEGIHSAVPRAV
mmetsp:Transcript_59959/g.159485  ORF Transcript_59959/g.159485 Transcript_59959/m.159485 type:complete len:234 (-) Transcript_59959:617-1318(-)